MNWFNSFTSRLISFTMKDSNKISSDHQINQIAAKTRTRQHGIKPYILITEPILLLVDYPSRLSMGAVMRWPPFPWYGIGAYHANLQFYRFTRNSAFATCLLIFPTPQICLPFLEWPKDFDTMWAFDQIFDSEHYLVVNITSYAHNAIWLIDLWHQGFSLIGQQMSLILNRWVGVSSIQILSR